MAQGVKAPATKPFLQKLYTMLEDESGPARSTCCLGGATACCPGHLWCEASGLSSGCSTHSRGAPRLVEPDHYLAPTYADTYAHDGASVLCVRATRTSLLRAVRTRGAG